MSQPWSASAEPAPQDKEKPRGDAFASDRFPELPKPVPFDGKRAMGHLEDLCKIGTRISGSDGMKKQQELIEKHFKDLGAAVAWQKFTATQKSERKEIEMANLVVSWNADRPRRVLLCSHYDTRPHADEERDPRKRREPFISANDGGSGVALLMELGRHMKDLNTPVGVDFAFFDGEEYVFDREDEYFFGSRHFAREYARKLKAQGGKAARYVSGVLLDMVGGKDAQFPIEQNSWMFAGSLAEQIWGTAKDLKCTAFRGDEFSKVPVEDDHIALNKVGIPTVDVIDFDYKHWHKVTDLPENCSGDSLDQVARVLSVWLQRIK
jgi:hypothetical protein